MNDQPWQCPDCGGWFGPSAAHGCGGPAVRVVYVPPEADKLADLEAENAKLREENIRLGGASTMMACTGCGKGVRPRYAVRGMCAECAGAALAIAVKALEEMSKYGQGDGHATEALAAIRAKLEASDAG